MQATASRWDGEETAAVRRYVRILYAGEHQRGRHGKDSFKGECPDESMGSCQTGGAVVEAAESGQVLRHVMGVLEAGLAVSPPPISLPIG